MGAGVHGGFGNTKGYEVAVAGDTVFVSGDKLYFQFISKRKDIDINGNYDVVAHGNPKSIYVEHNGKNVEINSRIAAKLIKSKRDYEKGKSIRLLSCNTGQGNNSFAQNLANIVAAYKVADLYYVLSKPNKISFDYYDEEYVIESTEEDNGIVIKYNDKWFRNIDDFMRKAELNGELLAKIYFDLENFKIIKEN